MRKSVGHQCGAGRVQVHPNYDLRPELMFAAARPRAVVAWQSRFCEENKVSALLMILHISRSPEIIGVARKLRGDEETGPD